MAISVNLDVFVHVLAAYQSIIKNVGKHCYDEPVRVEVACNRTNQHILNVWHYTTTHYETHEPSRCLSCIFAETFSGEVEDSTPHHRCTKTAEEDEDA